ncbi:MAG: zinc-ribbon domain-containing protein [Chloroflexota bacterium]
MNIGEVYLILAVLILVAMFISTPFMKKQRKHVQEDHEISSLLSENERILNALQELDFDNKLGKIPSEDYPTMRKALMQKGVSILQQLDEYQQTASPIEAEKIIEATIASRRADSAKDSDLAEQEADEELEAMIARRRNSQKAKSAGFCPKCGNPILASDTFCPKCGNTLK